MPATRHRFSKCGHRGFGGVCHRCQQANDLEKLILSAKGDDVKLKTEIERLKGPQKSRAY